MVIIGNLKGIILLILQASAIGVWALGFQAPNKQGGESADLG